MSLTSSLSLVINSTAISATKTPYGSGPVSFDIVSDKPNKAATVPGLKNGLNVVVIDETSLTVQYIAGFNMADSQEEEGFAQFIDEIQNGRIVIIAAKGSPLPKSGELSSNAIRAAKTLGSEFVGTKNLKASGPWVFLGRKGSAAVKQENNSNGEIKATIFRITAISSRPITTKSDRIIVNGKEVPIPNTDGLNVAIITDNATSLSSVTKAFDIYGKNGTTEIKSFADYINKANAGDAVAIVFKDSTTANAANAMANATNSKMVKDAITSIGGYLADKGVVPGGAWSIIGRKGDQPGSARVREVWNTGNPTTATAISSYIVFTK